jgi:hypothetical protein
MAQVLAERGWRATVELHAQPASPHPFLAPISLAPVSQLRGGQLVIAAPNGVARLRAPDPEITLDAEEPNDVLLLRLGDYEVRALGTSSFPTEVAWRIGTAVFTASALFGAGVWPAAATPRPVLALPDDTVVYPRLTREPPAMSTVGLERLWFARWCERGYRADIPDESATVRPAGSRIA